jgi:hypothetical protein
MMKKKDRRKLQRKTKKDVVISIRLPKSWIERIEFHAALARRNRSDFLRYEVVEPWLVEVASQNIVQDEND